MGSRHRAVEDLVSAAVGRPENALGDPPGDSPGHSHHGRCRICRVALSETFADLGMTPLANSFVEPAQANRMEPYYPLHALVCPDCRLVQLAAFETPARIFGNYLYFSSYSESWLRHAQAYAQHMIERFR